MEIALYQPDIPQNLGAIMRLCACLGAGLQVIEPCAFPLDEKRIRRAGMDYIDAVRLMRHTSFNAFCEWTREEGRRIVLATTKGATPLYDFSFRPSDILLFGRESAGAPERVHEAANARLFIPMQPGMRSLNLAVSAGIVLSEALRQTGRHSTCMTPEAVAMSNAPEPHRRPS